MKITFVLGKLVFVVESQRWELKGGLTGHLIQSPITIILMFNQLQRHY